jgi:hypothetical protein
MGKSFLWMAILPVLLILTVNTLAGYKNPVLDQTSLHGDSSSVNIFAKASTPTPTSSPSQEPPTTVTQPPARQRNPGLVAGAIVIALIIIIGVLRYSRRR